MFNLFGRFKKNSFLGIDFGTASIKVTELCVVNEKPSLVNYGWAKFDFIQSSDDARLEYFDDRLKAYLQALVKKMKPKTIIAYASVPGFNGLVTLIEFPRMKTEELNEAIMFEAHKYIPSSMDEVAISWDIVSKGEEANLANNNEGPLKKIQVLLVAAPKEKVVKYENLIKAANLKIKATELETFSLSRSLVGDDMGTFLIVDIGFRACTIVLVEKGIVKANRSIDIGGNDITKSIADNLNISVQRAEMIKKQGKDLINGQESAIVLPTLNSIVGEVSRIIRTFKDKNKYAQLDGIILSGGTSKLAGISEYFTKILGTRTAIGDPWKRITHDEQLDPVIKNIGASFSVSVGLALRGVEEYKRNQ